jgi:hypothetical protein
LASLCPGIRGMGCTVAARGGSMAGPHRLWRLEDVAWRCNTIPSIGGDFWQGTNVVVDFWADNHSCSLNLQLLWNTRPPISIILFDFHGERCTGNEVVLQRLQKSVLTAKCLTMKPTRTDVCTKRLRKQAMYAAVALDSA